MSKFLKGLKGGGDLEGDDGMDDITSQIASLGASMQDDDVPISKGDVDKVVMEALKAVKQEGKQKKGAAAVEKDDGEQDDGPDFVQGKDFLEKGMKAVRLAVEKDTKGLAGAAVVQYDAALENFGSSLSCGVPASEDARKKLMDQMAGYMDRMHTLLTSMDAQKDPGEVITTDQEVAYTNVNKNRVQTLQMMGKHGFSVISRGVSLRKKAKAQDEKAETWEAFLLYSEAIDCFVAYMKAEPTNETVKKAVFDMLDVAERLKKEL